MNKNKNRKRILVLSAAVFVAVALVGFGAMAGYQHWVSNQGIEPPSPTPGVSITQNTTLGSFPLAVNLSISTAPALNETAELTCVVTHVCSPVNTTTQIIPNITARIGLPEGFVLVSGNLTWNGDIIIPEEEKLKHPLPTVDCTTPEGLRVWKEYEYPKGRAEFSVVVKPVKAGNWTITATTEDRKPGHFWGDTDHVYVGVREDTAWLRETEWPAPVNNWYDYTQPLPEGPASPKNNQQIESELLFSTTPELNKEITITYRVTPSIDLPRTHIFLSVPPKGFELIETQFPSYGEIRGGFTWIGSIKKGQTAEINATYRIINTGWGPVYGRLSVPVSGEITDLIVDVKMADLSVDAEGGKITPRELKPYEAPPGLVETPHKDAISPEPVLPPGVQKKSKKLDETANLSGKLQNHTRGEVTITGGYRCWVSENTFTGGVREDVSVSRVWAQVWIFDGNDNFLGGGLTGDDGRFSIIVENPGAIGYYVQTLPNTGACHVTKSDGSEYIGRLPNATGLYYPPKYDIGGDHQVVDDPEYKGAWRIYETIVNDAYDRGAWDFLKNDGPGYEPPMVNVMFPFHETSYNGDFHRIHIETVEHTKALDVVQHEYGHFIMNVTYGVWTTPCPFHALNIHTNPECAWHEGWAYFFPLAVQDEPYFEWGNGYDCDLEDKSWYEPDWDDGDDVEGRVAGALNDIFDDRSHDDGYDTFCGGFNDIWDVVHGQTDNNFYEFYQAWCAMGHDVPGATAAVYQNTIVYGRIYVDTWGWWYEGGEYHWSSTPIQDAVEHAGTGSGIGEIIVYPGTYTENVDLGDIRTRDPLTIRSLSGNPEDTIVQAADPSKPVFNFYGCSSFYVTITGFTFTGATEGGSGFPPAAGIHLDDAYHCNISNNIVTNNYDGIVHSDGCAFDNTITNNRVSENYRYGMLIGGRYSNSCSLTNNFVCCNCMDDIHVWSESIGITGDYNTCDTAYNYCDIHAYCPPPCVYGCPYVGPDLWIKEAFLDTWIVPGVNYTITYTVWNVGNVPAIASTTGIIINGVRVYDDPVPALDPGASYTNTVGPFDLANPPAPDSIEVCADIDDDVFEYKCSYSEQNNCRENHFGAPDLVITDTRTEWIDLSWKTYNVIYTVKNVGDIATPSECWTNFTELNGKWCDCVGPVPIPAGLGVGESVTHIVGPFVAG